MAEAPGYCNDLTHEITQLPCHRPRLSQIKAVPILPGEMPADHFVRDGKKSAAGAFGALDLGLLAETSRPFVGAGRLVAGLTGFAALETTGISPSSLHPPRWYQMSVGLICCWACGVTYTHSSENVRSFFVRAGVTAMHTGELKTRPSPACATTTIESTQMSLPDQIQDSWSFLPTLQVTLPMVGSLAQE